MDTVDFVISDDDLNLVIDLLDEVEGDQFYRPIWQTFHAERDRRTDDAAPMPIRLDRDRAIELSEWLAKRARAAAQSTDARENECADGARQSWYRGRVGAEAEVALTPRQDHRETSARRDHAAPHGGETPR